MPPSALTFSRRALIAGAALAVAGPARADEPSDLVGLLEEPVVSAASRTAQTASTAPATTSTITAEDLRRWGIRSLDEALNFLSLGMITENPRETVEIGVRGVLLSRDYGDHVLLLVDGHAMNEQWGGTAYFDRGAAIPLELVDHIEVILGPGSVLYGSSAMLGVINVVTKRAKDFAGLHGSVESELPISIRGAAGFGREFKLFGRPAELVAAVEYFASKGPASSFGPQVYGSDAVTGTPRQFNSLRPADGVWTSAGARDLFFTQEPAFHARLAVGSFELMVRGAMFKRWNPFTGGTDLGATDGYERDRWLSIDARWHATVSPVVRLAARVYGDLYDYREYIQDSAAEDCLEGQTQGCVYDLLGQSRWAGSELQASFDWRKDGRFTTLVGVDGRLKYADGTAGEYLDRVTLKSAGAPPHYGQLEKALGAYVEQTARPASWLDLNAGARLDVDERFGSHLSPRVAAAVAPWPGGHFKAVYAEAFRGPSAFERYFHDPKGQLAAPDLDAETARSVEGSFEQRLGAQRFLVGVFRSWLTELVVIDDATPEELAAAHARGDLTDDVTSAIIYRNAASVASYGCNVAFDGVSLGQRLHYGLGLTGAYARLDPGDGSQETLPAAAQIFGNARLAYDLGGKLPVLALAGRFAGKRPIVDSHADPAPATGPLVELRATVSGPLPAIRGLSYRLSANAVFASGSPYAVGPLRSEVIPLDRFRTTVGLAYDLPL